MGIAGMLRVVRVVCVSMDKGTIYDTCSLWLGLALRGRQEGFCQIPLGGLPYMCSVSVHTLYISCAYLVYTV